MRAGRGVRVVALLMIGAGCNGVFERPGHDFSVRVLDQSPITVVGQIFAPVRFAVDGCGAFDLALENAAGERRPLDFAAQPDGTFLASVPVASMRSDVFCPWVLPYMNEVDEGSMVATCRDAGRSATAAFSIHPQLGGGWRSMDGDIRAVFPGGALGIPYFISTSAYGGEVDLSPGGLLTSAWAPTLNPAAYRNSLVRPRLVRSGQRAFATLGCEAGAGCPQVPIGPGELVQGERLADFTVSDDYARIHTPLGIAQVSSNVIDMAYAADGALVVVSDTSVGRGPPQLDANGNWTYDDAARWGETVVWRVIPAPDGAPGVVQDSATVIARMPRTTVATRLSRTPSGALAFATLGLTPDSVSVRLHLTDGSTVTTSYTAEGCSIDWCLNWIAGPAFVNPGVHLSPDGSSMILTYHPEPAQMFFWMNTDPTDQVLQPFGHISHWWPPGPERAPIYYKFGQGGAAWLPGAVALWTGGDIMFPSEDAGPNRIQAFEATAPYAFRFEYEVAALPGASRRPNLVGVIAVNDHLVLTTTTGVRILDATGRLVGGTDPFICGATTTATAEQIGPTTVAVGVGDTVVTFEVGP